MKNLLLQYSIEHQGAVSVRVATVDDAIHAFESHRNDPDKSFGSRELLTVPKLIDTVTGKLFGTIHYNGKFVWA